MSHAARTITRIAPAKVNLTLAVVARRPDGYHALHSVMATVGLADTIRMEPTDGPDDRLEVVDEAGRTLDLGTPADNLVLRAVDATRRAVGGPAETRLAVRLEKRIPVAAGLAGGSSDAAAALDGALVAWGVQLAEEARLDIAAGLGSDVPFFLTGGIALVEGRGESVVGLTGVRGSALGILLVTPRVAVTSPSVFAAFAGGIRPPGGSSLAASRHLADELRAGLTSDGLLARAGVLAASNDLVRATRAVVPELGAFTRALARTLGRPIGQSGSGPTAWVLYPSRAAAEQAAERVRDAVRTGALNVPGTGVPSIVAVTLAPSAGDTAP